MKYLLLLLILFLSGCNLLETKNKIIEKCEKLIEENQYEKSLQNEKQEIQKQFLTQYKSTPYQSNCT